MKKFTAPLIVAFLTVGIHMSNAQEISLECSIQEEWNTTNEAGQTTHDEWKHYISHIELSNGQFFIQRDDNLYSWQGTYLTYPSKYVLTSSEPKPQPPIKEVMRESYIDRTEARYYSHYIMDSGIALFTIISQGNCQPVSTQKPKF